MSTTLDYRLKGAFGLLTNNPDNPCLLNVLTFLILHSNSRGRCWINTENIASNATRGDPNKAVHAKRWLIEHDAIKLVPYEKRVGDEEKLPKRQHIFQLTGFIRNEDTIYPYLYLSDADLDEFKKAAEDVAGDIINQVHAKPKAKRMRDRKFVGIASKGAFEGSRVRDGYPQNSSIQKPDISSKPNSEISDVHIMNVPNQSISSISRISTTYQNFQNGENSGPTNTEIIDNALKTGDLAHLPQPEQNLPLIAKYTESGNSLPALHNYNLPKTTIYVDQAGDAVVDPTLMIVSANGHINYICPSCRSYVTDEPNKLCSKCRAGGIQLDVKTLEALNESSVTIEGKYPKEVREKVTAVQLAITRCWPGKSQAYAWAGRIAQTLVGVAPKSSGDFYTYRLRQEATPNEVVGFADWWKKNKLDGAKKPIDMPTSPAALEQFFSEYREYVQNLNKKKVEGGRKYIEIDMSDYK